ISGTVQDQSGAVVAGVSITIVNTATGIKRDTATNAAGIYRFAAVEPGSYTVEFLKSGFEAAKVGGIEVRGAQEVVVKRAPGGSPVATSVEIQATPPGVELAKSTATIDRKRDGELVRELPTTAATRDVTRLTLLAPMAVRVTGNGGGIAVNGQRAR